MEEGKLRFEVNVSLVGGYFSGRRAIINRHNFVGRTGYSTAYIRKRQFRPLILRRSD